MDERLRIEDLSAEELEELAADYPAIRRRINRLEEEGGTGLRLPKARGTAHRLAVLHELEQSGELWLRAPGKPARR